MTGVMHQRASDDDRDRAVRVLRDAAVDGRLGHDSFVRRVDQALRARDRHTLDRLVGDLGGRRGTISGLLTLTSLTQQLGRPPAQQPLHLPDQGNPVVVVGRRPDCDLVLTDTTVSREHAVLMLFGGRWHLEDRGSTNGTRVNGRRIWGSVTVAPGDVVSFGKPTFRLVAPDRH